MSLHTTTSQTVGPFFHLAFDKFHIDELAGPSISGQHVEVKGRVFDGDGQGISDAVIEIWQANAHGKYAHPEDRQEKPGEPGFLGFGRTATASDGSFHFHTIKPGRVPDPAGSLQAPHILVSVFMRGLLRRLVSRMYFPDEASNAEDYVLGLVEPSRRHTLIARKSTAGGSVVEWNLVVQGPDETVFFDC